MCTPGFDRSQYWDELRYVLSYTYSVSPVAIVNEDSLLHHVLRLCIFSECHIIKTADQEQVASVS